MEVRINCKHIKENCKCFHPDIPKFLWFFRRTCIVIDKLEPCSLREDLEKNERKL